MTYWIFWWWSITCCEAGNNSILTPSPSDKNQVHPLSLYNPLAAPVKPFTEFYLPPIKEGIFCRFEDQINGNRVFRIDFGTD